jgi:hypothetical protein
MRNWRTLSVAVLFCLLQASTSSQPAKVLAPHKPVTPRITTPQPQDIPVQRSLVGGLWMVGPDLKASIHIGNDVATSSISATPILHVSTGRSITLPQVKLDPSGIAVISIDEALKQANIVPTTRTFGYVEIQYSWAWDAICASVKNIDIAHSLIFIYTLEPSVKPDFPGSISTQALMQDNILEGFWWKQEPGVTGFFAFSNVAAQPVHANIVVSDDGNNPLASHSVVVAPRQTVWLDLSEIETASTTQGGIRMTFDGPTNGLKISGGLEDPAVGYSARIPLHFPPVLSAQHATVSYAALDLMTGAADPNMSFPNGTTFTPYSVVRNISNQPLTVTPTLWWMVGIVPHSASLASLTVAPYQTVNLNVPALLAAAGLKDYAGSFNLELQADGQSRAFLEAAGSVDQTNTYVFEVTPKAAIESVAKTLSYWSTANGDNTMVTLWNPADEPQSFNFVLHFSGGDGQYIVPIYLNGRETRSFNISTIINSGTADADGNVIPPGTNEGRAEIMGSKGENEHILIAIESGVYNVQKATCGSTYCQSCDGAVGSSIAPSPSSVGVGRYTNLTFTVKYKSGSTFNDTSAAAWSSSNTAVATVSTGTVHGVAIGTASMSADESDVEDYFYTCNAAMEDLACPVQTGQRASGQEKTLAVPTVTLNNPGNIPYGDFPSITATVTSNSTSGPAPTGTVNFAMTPQAVADANDVDLTTKNTISAEASWNLSSGTAAAIPVAAYDVDVNYNGDSNYEQNAGSGTFAIVKAESNTTIQCPSSPVPAGSSQNFTIRIDWLTPPTAIFGAAHPTGQVMLTASPSPSGTLAQTSGTLAPGSQTITLSLALKAGSYTMKAAYQGDSNYNTSTGQCTITAK